MWFVFSRVLTARNRLGRKLRTRVQTKGTPLARVRPADLAAAGVERVPEVTGVRTGHPVLNGGQVLEVSNVIWCTGFGPGLDWIDLPLTDEHGAAVQDRGVAAQQPGLYFVGQLFLHSLTSALVGGVGRDAEYVARHIASRQERTSTRRRRGWPAAARATAR
jgi:putative flavoprotein involved in K+ transport